MSAPLQYNLILPSDPRITVDIRFLVELNSQTLRISNSWVVPSILTKTDLGFRV